MDGSLPPSAAERTDPSVVEDRDVAFILSVGRALHAHGAPAHRLEGTLGALSARLGREGNFFCTPTSILAAFGEIPAQRTYMVRLEAGDLDLGKLAEVDEIVAQTVRGELRVKDARHRIAETMSAPPRHGGLIRSAAHVGVASSSAILLGGGPAEAAVAAGIGAVVAALEPITRWLPSSSRLLLPVASLFAAGLATLATQYGPVSSQIATVAGIVILLPGLTLTTAMNEVATGHVVSGTARLSSAMVAFLLLGFGVALGGALGGLLGVSPHTARPAAVPAGVVALALVASTLLLPILMRARPRDLPWVSLAGVLAFLAGRGGAETLGPELGGFVGALALGLAGNAYARFAGRPAAVVVVPGILLLVPGSIGFRSVQSFLSSDTIAAVDTAFSVGLVAITLVAGLLAANLSLPPKKPL